MSTNIEKEVYENRRDRVLQHGPGTELLKQVDSRDELVAKDESQKFYRRKGTSTLGGFNQTQMYKDGVDPQTREDGSYVIPNQYRLPGTGSMFGYDPVDGKKLEDVTSKRSGWGAPLRIVGGAVHDLAQGTVGLGLDVAEGLGAEVPQLRANFENYQQPEWLEGSSGWGEDIGRAMAQYGTGYGGALKSLGSIGLKSLMTKNVAASVAAGQTFDPAEGNVGTLLNDFGMLPETLRFLDSKMADEEYGRFQGRLALALEEIIPGATIGTAARATKMMRTRYRAHGDEMIKQGVMQFNNATGSLNHPTLGSQGLEVTGTENAERAVNMIASGMQIKGSTVDQFLEQAKFAGVDEAMAKKAWNNAAKEKLERVSEFMAPKPAPGPMARQKGNIDLFSGQPVDLRSAAEDVLPMHKTQDVESMERFYKKQVARGNVQPSEYGDVIKPTLDRMKELGTGKATGEQMVAYMNHMRPEFKTITKAGEDVHHKDYTFSPSMDRMAKMGGEESVAPTNIDVSGDMAVDYKEHLFTARNEKLGEGKEGYVNEAHFSEPFVKGIARTSVMAGEGSMPGAVKNGKMFIQELQSDHANVARKYGEWTDEQIKELAPTADENLDEFSNRLFVAILGEQKGKALTKKLDDGDFDDLTPEEEKINEMSGDVFMAVDRVEPNKWGEFTLDTVRRELAAPSVFNKDKAWIRQTMRPVIEDARKQGINKIVLASSDIINKRWSGNAPHGKYQTEYPKIMKQYFKDLGIPEKNIHMPTKSSESFWVELPDEVMAGRSPLPQYSIGASAPLTMKLGEEDDK